MVKINRKRGIKELFMIIVEEETKIEKNYESFLIITFYDEINLKRIKTEVIMYYPQQGFISGVNIIQKINKHNKILRKYCK